MIINRNESDVAVLGDVKKYKVGIDEKNISHIITILSSNLYSHPMTSFLRETVSNAVDSHIEAGVDEPIIITITDKDISIRDYGTGISPERFEEIYTNIGSSTKRESNDFIGSFGIGRFSALSINSLVNVTSFYNGKASYYVMNKDIDQLHVDLIFDKDTDEKNGVEVKVAYSKKPTGDDWRCLSFIRNVYIEDTRTDYDYIRRTQAFNKRKIHTFKTFKILEAPGLAESYATESYKEVLVGNIPYRVDFNVLTEKMPKLYDWEKTFCDVYPIIGIGELDVTPNREGLLYSDRTVNRLIAAYTAAIEELTDMWNAYCTEVKTDFFDFVNSVYGHWRNVLPITEDLDIQLSDKLLFNLWYKGLEDYNYDDITTIVTNILSYKYPDLNVLHADGTLQKEKGAAMRIRDLINQIRQKDSILVIVPNKRGFSSNYFKGYVHKLFPGKTVYFVNREIISKNRLRSLLVETIGISGMSSKEEVHKAIRFYRELLKAFGNAAVAEDILATPEYQKYKEEHKEKATYKRDNTKITFYVQSVKSSYEYRTTDTVDGLIKQVRKDYPKERLVYATLNHPLISALQSLNYPNLIVISVAESKADMLRNGLLPDYIQPIESIYSENDRHLRRFATARYLKFSGLTPHMSNSALLPDHIIKRYNAFMRNTMMYSAVSNGSDVSCLLDIVPQDKYDYDMLAEYNILKPYLEWTNLEYRYTGNIEFLYYVLMKQKRIRLPMKAYNRVKERINTINTFINENH